MAWRCNVRVTLSTRAARKQFKAMERMAGQYGGLVSRPADVFAQSDVAYIVILVFHRPMPPDGELEIGCTHRRRADSPGRLGRTYPAILRPALDRAIHPGELTYHRLPFIRQPVRRYRRDDLVAVLQADLFIHDACRLDVLVGISGEPYGTRLFVVGVAGSVHWVRAHV